ncbi:hypothetical protein C9374_000914 [Naegleria lovaniensis]|uniref:Uncharacterized protein n=1 Tax=Naegleria lovaniensis TaxID=51637 RepID=A0AA88GXR5_NAELO|nr:uncharacterized protein C9374_000914 [Naegleria lovaniensis]KAG2388064.1 hypothetical protein C9374_000914 [Naegleria lovaniensis]
MYRSFFLNLVILKILTTAFIIFIIGWKDHRFVECTATGNTNTADMDISVLSRFADSIQLSESDKIKTAHLEAVVRKAIALKVEEALKNNTARVIRTEDPFGRKYHVEVPEYSFLQSLTDPNQQVQALNVESLKVDNSSPYAQQALELDALFSSLEQYLGTKQTSSMFAFNLYESELIKSQVEVEEATNLFIQYMKEFDTAETKFKATQQLYEAQKNDFMPIFEAYNQKVSEFNDIVEKYNENIQDIEDQIEKLEIQSRVVIE